MFIRSKKIKGKRYAYIVKNKWTRKGPRQRVKGYLGRIYKPEMVKEIDFIEFVGVSINEYIDGSDKGKIIRDLVKWELVKHGFKEEGTVFVSEGMSFDFERGVLGGSGRGVH